MVSNKEKSRMKSAIASAAGRSCPAILAWHERGGCRRGGDRGGAGAAARMD
jgi:hypothetical protein